MTGRQGERWRVGVVGLGSWGLEHVRAWRAIRDVELVALCSRDPARLKEVAGQSGVALYSSAGEMATEASLDAVSIVTDEVSRVDSTMPFIDAGVHVLVEKPMAPTVADAELMVRRALERGVTLMPGHILRFTPEFVALKERIDRGDLGRVRSVYARRLIPRGRHATYQRTHPALMAAIHDLDLARWYLGEEPISVHAVESTKDGDTSPDLVWAMVRFPRGGIAVIENGWVLPDEAGLWIESEAEVIGSRGVARISIPSDRFGLYLESGHERPDGTVAFALGQAFGGLVNELSYFVDCLSQGRQPDRVQASDGVESLRLAIAVAQSASTGEVVQFPGR